ncbi:peptidoglycan-binding protein [Pseudalkalibacillus berkeleyi]|uniref:Peptidoglycan-binding protein n=1 Tax=Pseudalkalibacillus berkeleyi TaxID=1069813 RepID=A0ABS9GX32_9BACL|nr:peptidoglycan-binding protein [Pseudalkalibacillus berkeleyi]MCF6136286.1 peptidoglycan-binding protein [Pseudalkalibacillus berkeleyi]
MFKKLALTVAIAGTAALAPTATQAAELDKPLKKNMWDEDVHTIQKDLKELGFFNYDKSTGYFGSITHTGVKNFQKDYDLKPTGTVDQETADVLEEATEMIERGDRGKAVQHLQKHLAEMKLYNYKVDGIFGPITEKAVENFQNKNSLQVDGIAGPETKAALFNLNEAAKKAEPVKEEAESTEATTTSEPEEAEASAADEEKTMTMQATAYTADCNGCSGVTATGIDLNKNPDQKVIAVDPNVIPLGTEVYVEGYGRAVAGDTGGAINGNKIDLYMQSQDKAEQFGVQQVEVTILD